MKNKFDIVICTKNRFGTVTKKDGTVGYQAHLVGAFYDHAVSNDIHELDNIYLVIEENNVEGYTSTFPKWPKSNIIVIGDENKGVAFARQSALMFLQSIGSEEAFMLDDEIRLGRYDWLYNAKAEKHMYMYPYTNDPLTLLDNFISDAKRLTNYDKVGQHSFTYQQFGWCSVGRLPEHDKIDEWTDEKQVSSNLSNADCAVLLRPMLYKSLGIHYDFNCNIKEDRDLTAQIISKGLYARKMLRYMMDSPLNSTTSGGCHEIYREEGCHEKACNYLINKWNNVTKNKMELTKIKETKTCYGRNLEVKFYWSRIYNASLHNLYNEDYKTPFNFPNTIYNFRRLE